MQASPTPASRSDFSSLLTTTPATPSPCKKILAIVKMIFLILAGLALFLYSPLVFLASYTIGIIYAQAADEAINKINQVWKAQALLLSASCIGYIIIGLPAALLISTVLIGLYQGSQLYQWSTKTYFSSSNSPTVVVK